MAAVCISEAARQIGHGSSRSQLYRLMDQDLLKDFERADATGSRLLETIGLADQVRRVTRKHPRNTTRDPNTTSSEGEFWDDVAEYCNNYIEPSLWGPPPWTADRWVVLYSAMDYAIEQVIAGRKFDPVAWSDH